VFKFDNGLDFVSKQFNEFCRKEGIRCHKLFIGIPQQNGLGKRINKTILEQVKYMLLGVGLRKSFWGKL